MKEISVVQLKALLDAGTAPKVIDVRETWEFETDHIEAENIPLATLPEHLSALAEYKDKDLILACRSGGRSGRATQYLMQQGFTNVMNLSGGMLAWKTFVDPKFDVE